MYSFVYCFLFSSRFEHFEAWTEWETCDRSEEPRCESRSDASDTWHLTQTRSDITVTTVTMTCKAAMLLYDSMIKKIDFICLFWYSDFSSKARIHEFMNSWTHILKNSGCGGGQSYRHRQALPLCWNHTHRYVCVCICIYSQYMYLFVASSEIQIHSELARYRFCEMCRWLGLFGLGRFSDFRKLVELHVRRTSRPKWTCPIVEIQFCWHRRLAVHWEIV